jgi:myxalamid-type polyketide synthase MxaE and MxaD
MGASVHVAPVDVGDQRALRDCLERWDREGRPPIRGVVHAAAVVRDRMLSALDGEAVEAVLHPKARGAWHLHRLLESSDLDFFVLFSSLAALLGGAGQAAYAAANASLDALASYRSSRGLPALAVDWGVWRDRGLARAEGGRRAVHHLAQMGLEPLDVDEALDLLELALTDGAPVVATLKVDPQRWEERRAGFAVAPILSEVLAQAEPQAAGRVRALVGAERDPERRRRLLVDHLREQVAGALQVDPARVDPRVPVGDLGVDSFAAIELRNRLEATLELTLSATMFWNHPTLDALAAHFASLLGDDTAPGELAAPSGGSVAGDDGDLLAVLEAAAALDAEEDGAAAQASEREPRPSAGAER